MENNKDRYHKAKERVKELREFYSHLFSYILVNIFVAGINYYSNQWEYPWFLWVTFGWGIGLLFNALRVYRLHPFYDDEWEEKKIKEYMEKDKHQRWE